ncbi:hypothetical protein LIER_30891 [Lithospermum erythrorhizon]|uniref:CCHC-type domain-containing protein n=1 Tax=Lithospermum erythrorhizon TaxID=34254 RepID=A0AAV3RRI1_LITER
MDKKHIMQSGLWLYDNQLLILKDWVREEEPWLHPFNECVFWLQVRGLKEEFFTWDVANKLVVAFQGCEEVELRRTKGGLKFFHTKSILNVDTPLRRLVNFQVEDEMGCGYLAYERLPTLCFKCGPLGHLIRQCPDLGVGADPRK